MQSTNPWIRRIGAVTAAAVLWTGAVGPASAASIWSDRRRHRPDQAPRLASLPAPTPLERVTQSLEPRPAVPAATPSRPGWASGWDLASVEADRPLADRAPDVLVLRDIHGQPEAQKNIASFLSSLATGGQSVLVGVEGAFEALDFRPYRFLGDAAVIQRLADAYLSWDWIQAPEYAGLTGPQSLRLVGVETESLYEGNVRAYQRAARLEAGVEASLFAMEAALVPVKNRLFTELQKDLDRQAGLYRTGDLDTASYLEALFRAAVAAPSDARFPQTSSFLQAREAEKTVDFRAAERERGSLLGRLSDRSTEEGMRVLMEQAVRMRTGELSAGSFHAALVETARAAGLDAREYSSFLSYVRYATRVETIDRAALLTEVPLLEEAAWKAHSPTADQGALRTLSCDVALARRLASHALTNDQWTLWQERLHELRSLPARAMAFGAGDGRPLPLESFESFYRYAKRRDVSLLENFLAARRPGETSVLVAGGFHAAGLAEGLKERGLSVLILTPRLNRVLEDKNALEAFTRGPTALDRLLLGDRIFLAARVGFGRTVPPTPGPRYGEVASHPLNVAAMAAALEPARAPEIVAEVARRAAEAKVFPLDGPTLDGAIRREGGATVVPLSARTPDGRVVRVAEVPDGGRTPGLILTPAPTEEAPSPEGEDSIPAPALSAVPSKADRAAVVARWGLPFVEAAAFLGISWAVANPLTMVGLVVAWRLGLAMYFVQHEPGHLLRAAQLGLRDVWTPENLRAHLPGKAWAAMLIPFFPFLWGFPHVTWAGSSPEQDRSVRRRGMVYGSLLSLSLAAAAVLGAPEAGRVFTWAFALGTTTALLLAVYSDWLAGTVRAGMAWCGINAAVQEWPEDEDGLSTVDVDDVETALLSDGRDPADDNIAEDSDPAGEASNDDIQPHPGDMESYLFETGSRVKEFRGHHSMGVAVLDKVKDLHRVVIKKAVNPKRAQLTAKLVREAQPMLRRLARAGGRVRIALAHWRVSTSSDPTVPESHPFQHLPNRLVIHYQVIKGTAVPVLKLLGNAIGANGDFNYLKRFGVRMSNGDVKAWLGRVLGSPNPLKGSTPGFTGKVMIRLRLRKATMALKGDSPALAGMLDLYRTQGLWDASLRLAFQDAIADSFTDEAPSPERLRQWAELIDKRFAKILGQGFSPDGSDAARDFLPKGASDLKKASPEARRALVDGFLADFAPGSPFDGWVPAEKARAFAESAVEAFLENDLNTAVTRLMHEVVGTFGVGFVSTLEPDREMAASLGQSVFLGFDSRRRFFSATSDGVVLKVPFGGGERKAPLLYRWATDNKGGEVVELAAPKGRGPSGARRLRQPVVRIYSLALKRELTEEEIRTAGRLEVLDPKKNPYITPIPEMDLKNPVRGDLQDTQDVLKAIRKDYRDGLNAAVAGEFAELLLSRKNPRVVLTGFAESRFVLNQFAKDLQALFPGLEANIQVHSPNKVVRERRRLKVGPEDIVLAVSQSGQTANTNAAGVVLDKKMEALVKAIQATQDQMDAVGNKGLFTMTGEMDSMLGYLTGQRYHEGAPFLKRNFTNMTGFRPSEAVTLTTTATHASLSEILLAVVREALRRGDGVHGFILPDSDAEAMDRRMQYAADVAAARIVGATGRGQDIESGTYRKLVEEGKELARIVMEPAITTGLSLGYLYLLLGHHLPLLPSQGVRVLSEALFETVLPGAGWAYTALGHLDWSVLGFLTFWLALAMRRLQNRPLWARLGQRLVVFADDQEWVGLSMKVLVEKVSALSFGVASAHVDGGNLDEDYAEVIQHKTAQRGTKVYLGREDGRGSAEAADAEASALMAGKQTNTNKHYLAGPETVTIGHNPARDANASKRDIVLPDQSEIKAETVEGDILLRRVKAMERFMAMQVIAEEWWERVSRGIGVWVFRVMNFRKHRTRGGARTATTATYQSLEEVFDPEQAVPPTFTAKRAEYLPFIPAARWEREEAGRQAEEAALNAIDAPAEETLTPTRSLQRPELSDDVRRWLDRIHAGPATSPLDQAILSAARPAPVPLATDDEVIDPPAVYTDRYALEFRAHADGFYFRRVDLGNPSAPIQDADAGKETCEHMKVFLKLMRAPADTVLRASPGADDVRRASFREENPGIYQPPLLRIPMEAFDLILDGSIEVAAELSLGRATWLEVRLSDEGDANFQYLTSEGEGFHSRPVTASKLPELRRRTVLFMGYLRENGRPGARILRVPLFRQGFVGGMQRFMDSPEPALYMTLAGFAQAVGPSPSFASAASSILELDADKESAAPPPAADASPSVQDAPAGDAPQHAPEMKPKTSHPVAAEAFLQKGKIHTHRYYLNPDGTVRREDRILEKGIAQKLRDLLEVAQERAQVTLLRTRFEKNGSMPEDGFRRKARRILEVPWNVRNAFLRGRLTATEAFEASTVEDYPDVAASQPTNEIPSRPAEGAEPPFGSFDRPLPFPFVREIILENGLVWSRMVNIESTFNPSWADIPEEAETALLDYAENLGARGGARVAIRVLPEDREKGKVFSSHFLKCPYVELMPSEHSYLLRNPKEAARKTMAATQTFGRNWNGSTALILMLGMGGMLGLLATSLARAAAPGGDALAAGISATAALLASSGSAGALITRFQRSIRLRTRSRSRAFLPELRPTLEEIGPATLRPVDFDEPVNLSNGLPDAMGSRRPGMILHLKPGQAAGMALLAAAEAVKRRDKGQPLPAVYLVVQGGSPEQTKARFLASLSRWNNARKSVLEPWELTALKARVAAGPADPFHIPDEKGYEWDGELALAAASRAVKGVPQDAWVLYSPQAKKWAVPTPLQDMLAVMHLDGPLLGRMLFPDAWKAFLAIKASA